MKEFKVGDILSSGKHPFKWRVINVASVKANSIFISVRYRLARIENGKRFEITLNEAEIQEFNKVNSMIPSTQFNKLGRPSKTKGKKIFFDEKSIILKTIGSKESFTATNNDDKFDLEKGIMMALLKSEGYTYSHIEKLIKEARPKSEIARVVSQWKE